MNYINFNRSNVATYQPQITIILNCLMNWMIFLRETNGKMYQLMLDVLNDEINLLNFKDGNGKTYQLIIAIILNAYIYFAEL